MLLQPLNLEISSLFLSSLDTEASAWRCSDPLSEGAKSKKIISTGWSSFALNSKPFDKIAKKPLGLSKDFSVAWGIAIPFPTAVEPNFC